MDGSERRAGEEGGRGAVRALADYLRSPPNVLTFLRLLSIPVLWALALARLTLPLAVGLALAFATDLIDGPLARRMGRTTELGSRTDSLADHLLTASTVAWLLLLRPAFFRQYAPWLLGWCVLAGVVVVVAWIRFRRFVDLHLYSAKCAVFLAYTMAIVLLATGRHSPWHWWLAFAGATAAALESLAVLLVRRHPDEHLGSILLLLRDRGRARARGT